MASIVECVVHGVNIRSAPNTNSSVPSGLLNGQQATVDTFAYGQWLHVIAPPSHIGYLWPGTATAPNVKPLDISIPSPSPVPSGDTEQVKVTTDVLNVRSGPATNYPIVAELNNGTIATVYAHIKETSPDGLVWYQIASSTPQWIAAKFTAPVTAPPAPPPAPIPPAPPPVGSWTLPLNAYLYGGHMNPGGYVPGTQEQAVFARNKINYALIPIYGPNQQGSIATLQRNGVQHFILRPAVSGGANASDFARITLPFVNAYIQALGGPTNVMIQLGNEPNLVAEGWTKFWQTGRDFAIWWLNVASIFRSQFPLCKLGFAPMSPGGDVANIRMSDETFLSGCATAIGSADWISTHNYWINPDASDLTIPNSWRVHFGSKPITVTETGPANLTLVTNQSIQRAHALYSNAGLPATYWIIDGSGVPAFSNASWLDHNITVV